MSTADRRRGSTLLVVFVVDTFDHTFPLVNRSTFTINHIVYREHVQLQRPVGREGGLWQCVETSDPCLSLSDLHVGCPSDLAVRLLTVVVSHRSSRYIKALYYPRGGTRYFF
jgi:hypothetical protein